MYYPLGNNSEDRDKLILIYGFVNEWTHFVFNRKLVKDENGNTDFIAEVYKNGELVASETYQDVEVDERYMTFTVLGDGWWQSGTSDLGTFIVRNKVIDADKVSATYEKEKDNYVEVSVLATAEKAENGGYDIKVTNYTSEKIDCSMMLAAYETKTKAFAGCATATITNGINPGESATENLLVEGLNADKGYDFKVFVWDSVDGMKPHTECISIDYVKPEGAFPDLLVDMDLSSYDGTAGSIIDASGNNAIFSQTEHVKKGTFTNEAGNDINYIDLFSEPAGESVLRGRAWIEAANTEGLMKESISCWVKMDDPEMGWGVLLAKVNAMGTDESNFEVGLGGDNEIWVMPVGNESEVSRMSVTPYTEGWNMFTFTREWNGDDVTWKTYINGVYVDHKGLSGTATFWQKYVSYETYGLSTKFNGEGDGGALVDFATFQVYNDVLTDAQVMELYENSYQDFIEFDGTFAPSNAQISIHERELLIDLPSGLTLEEAIASVTMTDEYGDEPEGGIDVSLIGTTIARVRFGKLKPNTTYTITGGRDGDCVLTTGEEYLLKEDFEDWDEGEIVFNEEELGSRRAKRENLTFGHEDNTIIEQTYKIESTGTGNKYLNLGTKTAHVNAAVGLKLDSYLTEGEIVYDMRIKPDKPGGSLIPISKIWGENIGSGFHYKDGELLNHYKEASDFGDFKKDVDGFINLNCLLSVKKITEEVGEETKDLTEMTVTFRDKLSSREIVFTKILDLGSKAGAIEFVSAYTNGDVTDNVSIDDILVYTVAKLEPVTNLNGFDPANKEMEILLSDEASDESLEKNLITITANDKIIKTKLLSKDGRKIKLQLSEHLDYNTEYALSLKDIKLESGENADTSEDIIFKTREYDIYASASSSGQNAAFNLKNNSSDNKEVLILFIGYDNSGIIREVVSSDISLGAEQEASPSLTLLKEAAKTSVFVWDITNGMKPVPMLRVE